MRSHDYITPMGWVEEIDELHVFFETYFLGTEASLDRLESVLAPSFSMVNASGTEWDRAKTIAAVRAARGHATSLRITTSGHRLLYEGDGCLVARYVEEHRLAERSNCRVSTVVFVTDDRAPNGVSWLRVHETWCPQELAGS